MGLNLSQIVNKFISMKRVDDDLRENPQGTRIGHEVVSTSENFWARLQREGKIGNVSTHNTTLPTGGAFTLIAYNPSPDTIFYPKYACVSATVDCELLIQVNTNIPQQQSMYPFRGFVKAGTPVQVTFDGETVISAIGTVTVGGINTGASAGVLYASIYGIEVNVNE